MGVGVRSRCESGRLRFAAAVGATAALAAALALLAAPPGADARSEWTSLRVMNIAHQGGENEAPSNTMYALERSLRLGADMLEVDIHTTADGHVVVIHDATVDRTTDGSGRIYDMTLAQVQALDAAHTFVPGEGNRTGRPAGDYPFRGVRTGERPPPPGFGRDDFRIPTLEEVLLAYPTVPINIEIKGAADADLLSFNRNAEALAALLNRLGRSQGVNVASFNDLALQHFRRLAPQIDLAPGIVGVAGFKAASLPPGPNMVVFQVPVSFEGIPVTDRDFVRRAHAGGYAVHVWTINDEPTILQLLGWDVDGIMTAVPTRLERVLCEQGVERPPRPRSIPGRHCSPRASIACTVEPRGPVRARPGGRLRVTLVRRDEFAGRCAGWVRVRVGGSRGRASARFDFGERPPHQDGARRRVIGVRPGPALRQRVRRGARWARVGARPYDAYVTRARVRIR